jgi:hypothetical protein
VIAVCKAVLELVKVLETIPCAPDVPSDGSVAANIVAGKPKLNAQKRLSMGSIVFI